MRSCASPFTRSLLQPAIPVASFVARDNSFRLDSCCVAGKRYPQFKYARRRQRTAGHTWLRLDGANRCNKKIRISATNGRSVLAKVVDECDSVNGCDEEHDFGPPCPTTF
ncbi:hypothetical protein BDA96_01G223400 [Sorghum bicolor]|uniref:Uncharacterized protein n=2 Tax=Sorghum bicolor TaxID=4558 RepID=A0A921UYY9_SORBI|nr:hypothetical protein BDA96_01G223400 [Sorghum bicolor]OQU91584.1 hypothetical protein SORBI_3001G209550 [Sorghum bicolor]